MGKKVIGDETLDRPQDEAVKEMSDDALQVAIDKAVKEAVSKIVVPQTVQNNTVTDYNKMAEAVQLGMQTANSKRIMFRKEGKEIGLSLEDGEDKEDGEGKKVKTFYSREKNAIFSRIDKGYYIQFKNNVYRTDDDDDIEFLRGGPSKGNVVKEGVMLPQWVRRLKDEEKRLVRGNTEEYIDNFE